MRRRTFVSASTALMGLTASEVACPAIARPAAGTLRFIPEGNLQNPDPIWTASTVARTFGYMVWDMLYGVDSNFAPRPQMVEGQEVSSDGLTWRFRLREGCNGTMATRFGQPIAPHRSADG